MKKTILAIIFGLIVSVDTDASQLKVGTKCANGKVAAMVLNSNGVAAMSAWDDLLVTSFSDGGEISSYSGDDFYLYSGKNATTSIDIGYKPSDTTQAIVVVNGNKHICKITVFEATND